MDDVLFRAGFLGMSMLVTPQKGAVVRGKRASSRGTPQHKLRKFVIKSAGSDEPVYTSRNVSGGKVVAKILTGKNSRKIVLEEQCCHCPTQPYSDLYPGRVLYCSLRILALRESRYEYSK